METEVTVTSGFAFHVHHDRLVEWCFDYFDRVRSIKETKPKDEQELRLKLFKLIDPRYLPSYLQEAGRAYEEAERACDEAERAYEEAWRAYEEARRAYEEAGRAREEAERAYEEALKRAMPKLRKLHRELCPDCPWRGRTIFPKQV